MPKAKVRASTIFIEFHKAEAELVGKAVVLTDGKPALSNTFGSMSRTDCAFRSEVTKAGGRFHRLS